MREEDADLGVMIQVLALMILMGCGLFARKTGMVDASGVKMINKIMVNFAVPALAIVKMQVKADAAMVQSIISMLFLSFAVILVTGLVGALIFSRENKDRRAVFAAMSMFTNCGFMGFPLIVAALGESALIYGVVYTVAFNFLSWTVGVYLFGGIEAIEPDKIIKNPTLWGVVIGMVLFFTGWRLPSFLGIALNMLADITSPMAMLLVGANLIGLSISHFKDITLLFACVVRLVFLPALALVVLRLFHVNEMLVRVLFLVTAMPAAASTPMIASLCGGDEKLSSRAVALTTGLCVVTIPLMLLLL